MTNYSTPTEINCFVRDIGGKPLFVCDMDGNVMTGYNMADQMALPLTGKDDPARQAIPFGTGQFSLDVLVKTGYMKTGIFAEKAMDCRLPESLVDFLNDNPDAPFKLAFLTSRGADDARKLLSESGVNDLDKVTLVADSGASLFINGKASQARILSGQEKQFLHNVGTIAQDVQGEVERIVEQELGSSKGCPKMFVEHKGIATNIHYREILSHFGQVDNSPLDKAIGAFLKGKLDTYVADGVQNEQGAPVFKTLDGPATVEVKVTDINKGHGLSAIVEAALASGHRPSAVIFTGDDVAKGNGTPGTDYYAMAEAKTLAHKFGIPFRNIHTHHPVGNDLHGTVPDENKSPDTLSAKFPKPPIDIVVPTPLALANIILTANGRETAPPPAPDMMAKTL